MTSWAAESPEGRSRQVPSALPPPSPAVPHSRFKDVAAALTGALLASSGLRLLESGGAVAGGTPRLTSLHAVARPIRNNDPVYALLLGKVFAGVGVVVQVGKSAGGRAVQITRERR